MQGARSELCKALRRDRRTIIGTQLGRIPGSWYPSAVILHLLLVTMLPPGGRVVALEAAPVATSARGELSLTIRDRPAHDLPLLVRLSAPTGVQLLENRLTWEDVVDLAAEQPRLVARLTAPQTPGTYEIEARAVYWVCDPELCRQRVGDVRWNLVVRPAKTP